MDEMHIEKLCVILTKADISCGFIPLKPIVKSRDELIQERISCYRSMFTDICNEVQQTHQIDCLDKLAHKLLISTSLVQGDIESLYISVEPVLYDRDAMIKEKLLTYLNLS